MFNALRKGFGLTGKTMFRRPVTSQYPEVKREPQPRFHGRHILNRYEYGPRDPLPHHLSSGAPPCSTPCARASA